MAVYRSGNRGTIRSIAGYSVKEACVKLYEAMKGLGTDEDAVIDVISSHTNEERQQIKAKYKVQYGKDLVKELDSELSFSFSKLVLALMVEPEEFLLDCIRKSICSVSGKKGRGGKLFKRLSSLFKEGLAGNESVLIGLLCSRSNADLKAIKKAYKKSYGDKLEDKIANDGNNMPNDVCSFILDMISGDRDEDEEEVDLEHLAEDIDELSASTNEDVLHGLLQERSFAHLRRLFEEMQNVCGKTILGLLDDLQGVVSPELLHAYKAVVTLIKDGEPMYYAERVKGAIEGAGTDDETLIKVLVLRAEVDLLDIMDAYEKKYKAEMVAEVGDDTSGDYKELILKILRRPPPSPIHQEEETNEEDEEAEQESSADDTSPSILTEKAPEPEEEVVSEEILTSATETPRMETEEVKGDEGENVAEAEPESTEESESPPEEPEEGEEEEDEVTLTTAEDEPPKEDADGEESKEEVEQVVENEDEKEEIIEQNSTVEEIVDDKEGLEEIQDANSNIEETETEEAKTCVSVEETEDTKSPSVEEIEEEKIMTAEEITETPNEENDDANSILAEEKAEE